MAGTLTSRTSEAVESPLRTHCTEIMAVAMVAPNGHLNGDIDMDELAKEARFTSGLILPPPEIKCEHTMSFFLLQ